MMSKLENILHGFDDADNVLAENIENVDAKLESQKLKKVAYSVSNVEMTANTYKTYDRATMFPDISESRIIGVFPRVSPFTSNKLHMFTDISCGVRVMSEVDQKIGLYVVCLYI